MKGTDWEEDEGRKGSDAVADCDWTSPKVSALGNAGE